MTHFKMLCTVLQLNLCQLLVWSVSASNTITTLLTLGSWILEFQKIHVIKMLSGLPQNALIQHNPNKTARSDTLNHYDG